MKKFILQIAAIRQSEKGKGYASMAYNPKGDGQDLKDGKIKQFLEVGTDMLVGRAFRRERSGTSTHTTSSWK